MHGSPSSLSSCNFLAFKASVFIDNLVHKDLCKLQQLLLSVYFAQHSVTGCSLRGYLEWSIQHPQWPGCYLGQIVLS